MIVTVARDMVARKDSGTGGGGRQEILFTIEIAEEDVLSKLPRTPPFAYAGAPQN